MTVPWLELTGRRNVQVTMQIIRALIEKSSRDLPLYAPYVMRILRTVLAAGDINMAEESVPVFQMFCEQQDMSNLVSDQEQSKQYDEIVGRYASFVEHVPTTIRWTRPASAPIAARWKSVGLQAIKSLCYADAMGGYGGRQINIIMPMILKTLYTDKPEHLEMMRTRMEVSDKTEKDSAVRRRMSIATVRTSDTMPDLGLSLVSVPATTADADRLAEEEIGMLALQSLKAIFVVNNRLRIRLATGALVAFLCELPIARKSESVRGSQSTRRPDTARSKKSVRASTWKTTILEMVTRWAPVQDRFVILVTVMETLIRGSTSEDHMEASAGSDIIGRLALKLKHQHDRTFRDGRLAGTDSAHTYLAPTGRIRK